MHGSHAFAESPPLATRTMPRTLPRRAQAASADRLSCRGCIWVRPEKGVEVDHLTWTPDNLPPQVGHVGRREDSQHAMAAAIQRGSDSMSISLLSGPMNVSFLMTVDANNMARERDEVSAWNSITWSNGPTGWT